VSKPNTSVRADRPTLRPEARVVRGQEPREVSRPSAATAVVPEANWARSSWDLLNGLDVVESELGELFDTFFDSDSGMAREIVESGDRSKDEWLRAFAVALADLDRELDPREVIQLGHALWRKKGHLPGEFVARDVHSTKWMLRVGRPRQRSRINPGSDP
jgi:hypothetical protein